MFKPTKPQHITNKAYVDNNSGGGSEPFVIGTVEEPAPSAIVYLDKTFGEIKEAYESGRAVVFYMNDGASYGSLTGLSYHLSKEGTSVKPNVTVDFPYDLRFDAELTETPYTEERLFALYPYHNFE